MVAREVVGGAVVGAVRREDDAYVRIEPRPTETAADEDGTGRERRLDDVLGQVDDVVVVAGRCAIGVTEQISEGIGVTIRGPQGRAVGADADGDIEVPAFAQEVDERLHQHRVGRRRRTERESADLRHDHHRRISGWGVACRLEVLPCATALQRRRQATLGREARIGDDRGPSTRSARVGCAVHSPPPWSRRVHGTVVDGRPRSTRFESDDRRIRIVGSGRRQMRIGSGSGPVYDGLMAGSLRPSESSSHDRSGSSSDDERHCRIWRHDGLAADCPAQLTDVDLMSVIHARGQVGRTRRRP